MADTRTTAVITRVILTTVATTADTHTDTAIIRTVITSTTAPLPPTPTTSIPTAITIQS